jgi:hypothetical protein
MAEQKIYNNPLVETGHIQYSLVFFGGGVLN